MGGYYITTGGLIALALLHVASLAATVVLTAWAMRCTWPHDDGSVADLMDTGVRDHSQPAPACYSTGRHAVTRTISAPTQAIDRVREGVRR